MIQFSTAISIFYSLTAIWKFCTQHYFGISFCKNIIRTK